MSSKSNWLPELLLLEDCDGSWARYVDEVFSIFYRDFIETQPRFQDKWVRCRRDLIDGKEAAFWHCISEGPNENDRRLAIRRCERIGWVRAIIEHYEDPDVDCWSERRQGGVRWLLWYNEEYLIVLEERHRKRDNFDYMQLLTAYCTEKERRRKTLSKGREEFLKRHKRLTPP